MVVGYKLCSGCPASLRGPLPCLLQRPWVYTILKPGLVQGGPPTGTAAQLGSPICVGNARVSGAVSEGNAPNSLGAIFAAAGAGLVLVPFGGVARVPVMDSHPAAKGSHGHDVSLERCRAGHGGAPKSRSLCVNVGRSVSEHSKVDCGALPQSEGHSSTKRGRSTVRLHLESQQARWCHVLARICRTADTWRGSLGHSGASSGAR